MQEVIGVEQRSLFQKVLVTFIFRYLFQQLAYT